MESNIRTQNKEANGAVYENREMTDNIQKIKEYVNIRINDSIFGYVNGRAPTSGNPIAMIYFPKSYYIAKFTTNDDFFMKYNKHTWKEPNDIIAEYFQEVDKDKYGKGHIRTTLEMAACGFVANPFGILQINLA